MKQASGKLPVIWFYAGLALATFIAFEQVCRNDFVEFDDSWYVYDNQPVQGGYILEREDEWIIELHLRNYEEQDTNYTINVLVDEELITDTIKIQPDRVFKYIVHIAKDELDMREVYLTVYKEGEDTPFEQATYYIPCD